MAKHDPPRRYLLMKITLKYSSPPIWRRFVAPSDMPLDVFHGCLQIIMGWDNSHLYEFQVGTRENCQRYSSSPIDDFFGGMDDFDDLDDLDDEDAADQDLSFLNRKGMKFTYVYDFGDSWTHEIVVEDANYDHTGDHPVVVLKGKMNCPPEDCGGMGGYEHILELIKNPAKDTDGILDWLNNEYDPQEFDIDEINAELARRIVGPKPPQKPVKKVAKKTTKKTVKKTTKKSTKKKSM